MITRRQFLMTAAEVSLVSGLATAVSTGSEQAGREAVPKKEWWDDRFWVSQDFAFGGQFEDGRSIPGVRLGPPDQFFEKILMQSDFPDTFRLDGRDVLAPVVEYESVSGLSDWPGKEQGVDLASHLAWKVFAWRNRILGRLLLAWMGEGFVRLSKSLFAVMLEGSSWDGCLLWKRGQVVGVFLKDSAVVGLDRCICRETTAEIQLFSDRAVARQKMSAVLIPGDMASPSLFFVDHG
jgi:hypothetical protein